MSLTLSVEPTSEPVSLTETKVHLRVTFSDDDTEINSMILAARELVEKELNRDLAQRTWVYTMESFTDGFELPKCPVDSITSIQYVDTDGVTQTLADSVYMLDNDKVYLKYGQDWPSVRDQRAAITVTFVSGYDSIPKALKHAILMTVADMYEHRENKITGTVQSLNPTVDLLLRTHRRMVVR